MNERLKETIIKGQAKYEEKVALREKVAIKNQQLAEELAKKREQELDKVIGDWIDANLYNFIQKEVEAGHDFLLLTDDYNFTANIDFSELAKRIKKIEGLDVWFEAREKITDYPSYDHITIKWKNQ